jgi:toxin ParE1/3/4
MSRIDLSPRANADLLKIWSFIASDSETHADAFIDKLDDTLRLLARQPGMGRRRYDLVPGIQSFPVASYIIFYRAISRGIEVVRVLHASRNIETLFQHSENPDDLMS